jgi:hypothetical protein
LLNAYATICLHWTVRYILLASLDVLGTNQKGIFYIYTLSKRGKVALVYDSLQVLVPKVFTSNADGNNLATQSAKFERQNV